MPTPVTALAITLTLLAAVQCASDFRTRSIPPALTLAHAAGTVLACFLCHSLSAGLQGAVLWAGTYFLIIALAVCRDSARVGLGGADLIVALSCGATVGAVATPGWVPVAMVVSALCAALVGIWVRHVPFVPLMWGASALVLWCA